MTSEPDRFILITGTARSGKSLLSWVLRSAPEFAFFAEPIGLWSVVGFGRDDDRLDESDASPRVARRLIARCSKAVVQQGKRSYLDDYAYHSLAVPFIRAILPRARIVHVIRDPFDLMPELCYGWTNRDGIAKALLRRRSALNLRSLHQHAFRFARNYLLSRLAGRRDSYGPRVPGTKDFARGRSIPEIAAFQWKQMVSIARQDLAKLPVDRRLEVRFDRLLHDTENEYRRVAQFAGVEDVEAVVRYAKNFVDPGHIATKKVEPTAEEWQRIWEVIGDLAEELGYESGLRTRLSSAAGEAA